MLQPPSVYQSLRDTCGSAAFGSLKKIFGTRHIRTRTHARAVAPRVSGDRAVARNLRDTPRTRKVAARAVSAYAIGNVP